MGKIDKILFKNILCYCSTIYPAAGFVVDNNLKTSYVIVQRGARHVQSRRIQFKNILCYCSTLFSYPVTTWNSPFKNILCYCSTFNPFIISKGFLEI